MLYGRILHIKQKTTLSRTCCGLMKLCLVPSYETFSAPEPKLVERKEIKCPSMSSSGNPDSLCALPCREGGCPGPWRSPGLSVSFHWEQLQVTVMREVVRTKGLGCPLWVCQGRNKWRRTKLAIQEEPLVCSLRFSCTFAALAAHTHTHTILTSSSSQPPTHLYIHRPILLRTHAHKFYSGSHSPDRRCMYIFPFLWYLYLYFLHTDLPSCQAQTGEVAWW